MKMFTIGENDSGQRLDRFVRKVCELSDSALQKAIRLKKIKINGKRAHADDRLKLGDNVTVWLDAGHAISGTPRAARPALPAPNVIYEDENILIAGKPAGLSVHADESGSEDTLITRIQAYLLAKGEWSPERENSFAPTLCHRLDRNTSGLVLSAKNAPSLRILNEKMKNREICKSYLCIVHGVVSPPSGVLKHYLWKDEKHKQVYVRQDRTTGAKTAVTNYKVLKVKADMSLVECTLATGRTHQIRVQMAEIGHPLLGDKKYGVKDKRRHQALCAYKMSFDFTTDAGLLNYLKGECFFCPETLSDEFLQIH